MEPIQVPVILSQQAPELLCFAIDTYILCVVDDHVQYINVQDLKPSILVKTYGHGQLVNCPNNWEKCFYRLVNDLIITGSHSILRSHPITDPSKIDRPTTHMGDKQYKIDGLYMILVSVSNDFEAFTRH